MLLTRRILLLGALFSLAALPPFARRSCAGAAREGIYAFFDGNGQAVPDAKASAAEIPVVRSASEVSAEALPPVAFTSDESISPLLVKAVDGARTSVQLILYDFNLSDVLAAIERARGRGVAVQVVLDEGHAFPSKPGSQAGPQIQALLKGSGIEAKVLRGLNGFGVMHNKIGIFDGRSVEFGSFNWTQSANTKNYENALFTTDPKRVVLYQRYWDWIWSNAQPADGPHGAPALSPGPPQAGGKPIGFNGASFPPAVFSPGGGTMDMILSAIRASRSTIDIAMFSFTQQEVDDALLERKQAGVQVRLVVDLSQSRTSPEVIKFLQAKGFDLRLCGGKGGLGVMHNKYAVFDGALLETGSYNWTKNAEENNFENADFSDDAPLVSAFAKNFEGLWKAAKPAADFPAGEGGGSSSGSGSRPSSFLPKPVR